MNELTEALADFLDRKAEYKNARALLLDMADRVVQSTSGAFGVEVDEVAILVLTEDAKHLRFIAPRRLADLGSIPITKRDSIAVGVLGKKSAEINNNVPLVKHVAFFESVKLRDRPVPIQKMITVPIMFDDLAIGVAQLSRKGESPSQAGPDFTPADVRKAQEIFTSVAPYLKAALPGAGPS
jgi:hypothetical protein